MKMMSLLLLGILAIGPLAGTTVSDSRKVSTASITSGSSFRPGTVFAVDTANNLVHFDQATPGRIDGSVPIRNLKPGENILGIDFRPATGDLYGLGSTSQVYVINVVTGFAAPVDGAFSPALNGTDFAGGTIRGLGRSVAHNG